MCGGQLMLGISWEDNSQCLCLSNMIISKFNLEHLYLQEKNNENDLRKFLLQQLEIFLNLIAFAYLANYFISELSLYSYQINILQLHQQHGFI